MSKTKKQFIIQEFDPESDNFDRPTGEISQKTSFTRRSAPTAVTAAIALANTSGGSSKMISVNSPQPVVHFKLKIATHAGSYEPLKDLREKIWSTLSTWAQKSRLKNRRGFRAHAIKELTFRTDRSADRSGSESIYTEIILGTDVYYAYELDLATYAPQNSSVTLSRDEVMSDLKNLEKQLDRVMNGYYAGIKVY